jgi:hypothetical protein
MPKFENPTQQETFFIGYLKMLSVSRLYSVHCRMINKCGTVGGMKIGRGNRSTQRKPPSVTLTTTYPTWSDLRLNSGWRNTNLAIKHFSYVTLNKVKVKLSLYRPWRPLGLRDVKAPTFTGIRLIHGGNVVSPRRRPFFTPRKIPDTHFCWRLSRLHGYRAAGKIR